MSDLITENYSFYEIKITNKERKRFSKYRSKIISTDYCNLLLPTTTNLHTPGLSITPKLYFLYSYIKFTYKYLVYT